MYWLDEESTNRVVDAVSDGGRPGLNSAADDRLVYVQRQTDQHLDHHRHEQVLVDAGSIVPQTPETKRRHFLNTTHTQIFS